MSLAQSFRTFLVVEELEPRCVLSLAGNSLFPADNPWNQKISDAPIAANSTTLVNSIGAASHFHPDFGTTWDGALNGIPFNIVSGSQPKVTVIVDAYPDESDLVPVPIPSGAIIEGDPKPSSVNTSDRHLIVYDKDNSITYELFNARKPSETADGLWHADSLAVWKMNENYFRPAGWTSADAAGLPVLPGLVRPDEVYDQKIITHALRFTVPRTRREYAFPATHYASSSTDVTLPRMGERFRLRQDFDISSYSAANQVILQALKDYGMIVSDNGGSWYLSGEPSSRWNDDELSQLKQLTGTDFEAVDLTPQVAAATSFNFPANGGVVTITGRNFSGAAGQLQVTFGTAKGTDLTILSDTELRVVAPPVAGAVSITVTVQTPYGKASTVWVGQDVPPPDSGSQSFFRDAFTRADSTTLGNTWLEQAGDLTISAARLSAIGSSNLAVSTAVSGADVRVEADVTSGVVGASAGLVARYSGPGTRNLYYAQIKRVSNGFRAEIWRSLGGTAMQLASKHLSSGAGKLRFEVQGNALKLHLNGKLVAQASDVGITGPGLTGVIGSSGVSFDNFAVDLIAQGLMAMVSEGESTESPLPRSSLAQDSRDGLFSLLGALWQQVEARPMLPIIPFLTANQEKDRSTAEPPRKEEIDPFHLASPGSLAETEEEGLGLTSLALDVAWTHAAL